MAKLPKIRPLSEDTIGQIAAGEVVERPAAVVKELVENSLDAGAHRITVMVSGAGLARIAVTDDGEGIDPEDFRLALARHATSKIRGPDDLWRLRSLGFRGEALPSIAAVSRLTLLSRPAGRSTGRRLVAAAGEIREEGEAGLPLGTTVLVEDLFFNAPVRRGFLKSASAEMAAVSDTIEKLALSRPDVAFELRGDRGVLIATSGSGDLRAAIGEVLGAETAKSLLPIELSQGKSRVRGFVAPPAQARSSRAAQAMYVNGRWVKHQPLAHVLDAAYHPLLPKGKFPLAVVFFELRPEDVDVNVHPTKREIRLHREGEVRDILFRAVRTALDGPRSRESPDLLDRLLPTAAPIARPLKWNQAVVQEVAAYEAGPFSERPFPRLRPVAQLKNSYILAEGEEGFYLIDQHAAHERIFFERLSRFPEERPSQSLLLPWTLQLTATERYVWEENRSFFLDLGFDAEALDNNLILIRAVPSLLERSKPDTFKGLLQSLQEEKGEDALSRLDRLRREVAACKAAVKAEEGLADAEMRAILDDLAVCRDPWHCPHGRPTLLSFPWKEIRYRFGRS